MTIEILPALVTGAAIIVAAVIPLAAHRAAKDRSEQAEARSRGWTPRPRRWRTLGTASTGASETYHIVNISETGAFLETAGKLRVGRELDLKLDFAGKTVPVIAKVVRVQKPGWGRAGGVGVHFTHCDASTRSMIENYVQREPPIRTAAA
jgi:Tfp pilus assembly protein PilZ